MDILISTNGKKHSQGAIRFAGKLLKAFHPSITLMHVRTSEKEPVEREDGDSVLRKGKDILQKAGIDKVSLQLKKAQSIAPAIIQETHKKPYDLLVMGSRGASDIIPGVSQYLLGDVPREVILGVEISTLTVPEDRSLEKILICVDGSIASKKAVEFWGNLQKRTNVKGMALNHRRIVLLNVIPELYQRFNEFLGPLAESQLEVLETLPGKRTQYLYDAKEMLKNYGIDAEIRLREGDIAEEILQEAERNYDLVLMGRSASKRRAFGTHSRRVVERAKIPVFVIKQ